MEINLKLSAVQQVRVWGCKGAELNSLGGRGSTQEEGVDIRGGAGHEGHEERKLNMMGGAGHDGRGWT